MGRLHARVYSQMPGIKLVGVVDCNSPAAEATARDFGSRPVASVDELALMVDAVTIATPTSTHLVMAEPFLKRRVACLIEKPLAGTVEEARQIAQIATDHHAIVQVGHIERFNPAVRAMARLQVHPRFIEVTRISPLTFRSLDVGVVLDMMIHDIDIVLRLAESTVARIDAVGVSVTGTAEDICNARLTFANGCVANVTASRLALKTERRLRVFSEDAYVSIDYQKRYGIVVRGKGHLDKLRDTIARLRAGEIQDLGSLDYKELVNVEELKIDDTEPLRAELDAFIESVRGKTAPSVSAEEGVAAVEVATRIVQAMKQSAWLPSASPA
jgi:predicted dehydrogenase